MAIRSGARLARLPFRPRRSLRIAPRGGDDPRSGGGELGAAARGGGDGGVPHAPRPPRAGVGRAAAGAAGAPLSRRSRVEGGHDGARGARAGARRSAARGAAGLPRRGGARGRLHRLPGIRLGAEAARRPGRPRAHRGGPGAAGGRTPGGGAAAPPRLARPARRPAGHLRPARRGGVGRRIRARRTRRCCRSPASAPDDGVRAGRRKMPRRWPTRCQDCNPATR